MTSKPKDYIERLETELKHADKGLVERHEGWMESMESDIKEVSADVKNKLSAKTFQVIFGLITILVVGSYTYAFATNNIQDTKIDAVSNTIVQHKDDQSKTMASKEDVNGLEERTLREFDQINDRLDTMEQNNNAQFEQLNNGIQQMQRILIQMENENRNK